MSLEGLLRLHLGGLFWTSVTCLVIWFVLGFVAKSARNEGDREAAAAMTTVTGG